MSIVTYVTSASHRYYAKRRKSEVRMRIKELARGAGVVPPTDEEMANETADQLASRAMALHRLLPE